MSNVANGLLREICREIEPSAAQKSQAKGSHRYVRNRLQTGKFSEAIQGSFLIGSYARRTAIAPIDDVDVMIQVDSTFWKAPMFASLPEPDTVIRSLHRIVKSRYRSSRVVSQRRSVGLYLSRRSIDIVPAVPTRTPNVFRIPDTRLEEWIETAPERHTWRVQELNGMNSGLFVPLVKLLKQWNSRLPSTAYFKSFCIESIAAQLFANVPIDDLADGLLKFFDFMVHVSTQADDDGAFEWKQAYGVSLGIFGARAPDISGLGGNALGGVNIARRVAFAKKAKVARNHLIAIDDTPTQANITRRLNRLF